MEPTGTEGAELPRWQRLLLPGGMLEDGRGGRTARDWLVDVLMCALAATIGALALVDTWSDHSEAMKVVDIALGVVALIALWWRRSHPVGVAAVVFALSAVSSAAAGPGVAALFSATLRASRRAVLWLGAVSITLGALVPFIYPGTSSYLTAVSFGLLFTVLTIGWGLFVRAQRTLVQSLHERTARLEAERRLHMEQARAAERRRIAREMHDVLAHRVSLLSLHAGALEYRRDASPEELAEAAGVIRANAHAALQELRDVIGVLREDEERGGPEPPQPTLADIPALVEESRAAGMRVRCTIEDAAAAADVPAAMGRTAYRVVQEGLTNARKHAPGAVVEVTVALDDGRGLVAEVVSRPAVGVGAAGPSAMPGAGTGLVGLAERVALAGGELRHGPDDHGDFVLRAGLPWRAA